MTIRFDCPHCENAITTEDSNASKKATCPNCHQPLTIPQPIEHHIDEHDLEVTPLSAIDVFSTSWRIYKEHIMLLVGSSVILQLSCLFFRIPTILLTMMADGAADEDIILGMFCSTVAEFPEFGAYAFLAAGTISLQLKIVKGQPTDLSELFRGGGRLFLQMAICIFLWRIGLLIGFAACLIPGIVICVAFFPWQQILVDRPRTGVSAFTEALKLTRGQRYDLVLIAAVSAVIPLIGLAICGVGVFLAVPFVDVIAAVTYMRLSGQEIVFCSAPRGPLSPLSGDRREH